MNTMPLIQLCLLFVVFVCNGSGLTNLKSKKTRNDIGFGSMVTESRLVRNLLTATTDSSDDHMYSSTSGSDDSSDDSPDGTDTGTSSDDSPDGTDHDSTDEDGTDDTSSDTDTYDSADDTDSDSGDDTSSDSTDDSDSSDEPSTSEGDSSDSSDSDSDECSSVELELTGGWGIDSSDLDARYVYDSDSTSFMDGGNSVYIDDSGNLVVGDASDDSLQIYYGSNVNAWTDESNPLTTSNDSDNWEANDEGVTFTVGDMTVYDCDGNDLGTALCDTEGTALFGEGYYTCADNGDGSFTPTIVTSNSNMRKVSLTVSMAILASIVAMLF